MKNLFCVLCLMLVTTTSSVAIANGFGRGEFVMRHAKEVRKLTAYIMAGQPPHAIVDETIRLRLAAISKYVDDGFGHDLKLGYGEALDNLMFGPGEAAVVMDGLTKGSITSDYDLTNVLERDLAFLIKGVRLAYHKELSAVINTLLVDTEHATEQMRQLRKAYTTWANDIFNATQEISAKAEREQGKMFDLWKAGKLKDNGEIPQHKKDIQQIADTMTAIDELLLKPVDGLQLFLVKGVKDQQG